MQAIYVPADDYTDPAPATTFAHLDASTNLSRQIAELGIYPAVDPLASTSRILDPRIVGEEHYDGARSVQGVLQRYKDLQDIIAILGMDELSEDDKLTRGPRAQDPALPVAAVLRRRAVHRHAGRYVKIEDTIKGFREIVDGKHDDIPEQAFLYVGTIEEVLENGREDPDGGLMAMSRRRKLELEIVTPERAGAGGAGGRGRAARHRGLLGRASRPRAAPGRRWAWARSNTRSQGKRQHLAVAGGFAEVLRDRVTCWRRPPSAPRRSTSSGPASQRARAEAVLRGEPAEAEFEQAQVSFRKALIRLQVHGRREP